MTRRSRKIVAAVTIGLLLFTQLAVAGYACLAKAPRPNLIHQVELPDAAKPCHGAAQENLNLCKQHCEQSAQSVDSRAQTKIDAPALPVSVVFYVSSAHPPRTWSAPRELPAHVCNPPLYIQHCRFLI